MRLAHAPHASHLPRHGRQRRVVHGQDAHAESWSIETTDRMNTPDPATPAEPADGNDTDPGEGTPSTQPASASSDNVASSPAADSDAGPNAGERASSATSPSAERDWRAGIIFAPYRW